MIQQGDVVYFKKVTLEPTRRSREIGFKGGNGFAVMLGIVPPFGREPTPAHLLTLMGQIGFVSFDDIKEFMGEEQMNTIVNKFTDKYVPKVPSKPTPQPLIVSGDSPPIRDVVEAAERSAPLIVLPTPQQTKSLTRKDPQS